MGFVPLVCRCALGFRVCRRTLTKGVFTLLGWFWSKNAAHWLLINCFVSLKTFRFLYYYRAKCKFLNPSHSTTFPKTNISMEPEHIKVSVYTMLSPTLQNNPYKRIYDPIDHDIYPTINGTLNNHNTNITSTRQVSSSSLSPFPLQREEREVPLQGTSQEPFFNICRST